LIISPIGTAYLLYYLPDPLGESLHFRDRWWDRVCSLALRSGWKDAAALLTVSLLPLRILLLLLFLLDVLLLTDDFCYFFFLFSPQRFSPDNSLGAFLIHHV